MRGLCTLLFLLSIGIINAQTTINEVPISFSSSFQQQYGQETIEEVDLPLIRPEAIRARDEAKGWTNRFAIPSRTNLSLANSGSWINLEDGSRVWRLMIDAREAMGLATLYEDFFLPPGARLHMYTPDRSVVIGAYTSKNNNPTEKFLTGFVPGNRAIIEYFEPATVVGQGRFRIFRVDQAYRENAFTVQPNVRMTGFEASLECNVNVNCPVGDDWQTEKRGIVRILLVVEEGTGFCSGSLMNNTAQDGRPFVLSGYHCDVGFTPIHDLWRFDFNYEGSSCDNPAEEPAFQSVLGCTLRSFREESDFQLLEAINPIPSTYNAYFNGWDKSEAVPTEGTMIHHPAGDIKKITVDTQALSIFPNTINWPQLEIVTPPQHHFRTSFDIGTYEQGSSGSPLFDQNHRIVGQLNGGSFSCEQFIGYFGRLEKSWEGGGTPETRLKDWLDPLNLGNDTLGGMAVPIGEMVTLAGQIQDVNGQGVAYVQVVLSGAVDSVTMTDFNGNFRFEEVPAGANYSIGLSKTGNFGNGVSNFDIIKMTQHILNLESLANPSSLLAADVNESGTISNFDIIKMRRVILALANDFDGADSWQFYPSGFEFADPADPFQETFPDLYHYNTVMADLLNLNFTGIKMGDVNGSADPQTE